MLPSNLLIARIWRDRIKPKFASIDDTNLGLAKDIIHQFRIYTGQRKGPLMKKLKEHEEMGFDFRFVRGLATLLERRCLFKAYSKVDPVTARRMVFEEANQLDIIRPGDHERILKLVSERMGISKSDLEASIWSDLEDELILERFDSIEPEELLKRYNLSLTQTLLFRSASMTFTANGNWQRIFRQIKQLGLMYIVQRSNGVNVSVEGPLSLFRLSKRYGTAIAKLLPTIVEAEKWWIKADVIRPGTYGKRIYKFTINSKDVLDKMWRHDLKEDYDSSVEESFSRRFRGIGSSWKLAREPEPIPVGDSVMIPDFSFESEGFKVYMEVVGFWTPQYLKRKVEKLREIKDIRMIVAVDKKLACSKIRQFKGEIIFYDKNIPLKPILEVLRTYEEKIIKDQVKSLKGARITLGDDKVDLKTLSDKWGVSEKALVRALSNGIVDLSGYRIVGDQLISEVTMIELKRKVDAMGNHNFTAVSRFLEEEGFKNNIQILNLLGYSVKWRDLDPKNAIIYKTSDKRDLIV